MMPMFCATKKEMRDRIPEVSGLDFSADFADDGVEGGDCEAVYKVLEKEMALGPEHGLRNNFDKMAVYSLAWRRFTGDISKFERLGIKVDTPVAMPRFLKETPCLNRWPCVGIVTHCFA